MLFSLCAFGDWIEQPFQRAVANTQTSAALRYRSSCERLTMRQIGALALGVWYSFVLSFFLAFSANQLSSGYHFSSSANTGHYVLLGIAWCLGVTVAAGLAACASKSHPALISPCTAAFVAISLFGFSYAAVNTGEADPLLPPLLFGWQPTVVMWAIVFGLLMIFASAIVGLSVRELETVLEPGILGIRGVHWLWLWVPMALHQPDRAGQGRGLPWHHAGHL